MTSNASGGISCANTEFRQERSSAPALYTGMTTLTRADPRSAVAALVRLRSKGISEHRRATPPGTINRGYREVDRVPTLAACDGPPGDWNVASALRVGVELVADAVVRVGSAGWAWCPAAREPGARPCVGGVGALDGLLELGR